MRIAVSTTGVLQEKIDALIDAQVHIMEYGDEIIFFPREEDDISRDKYNSLKQRDSSISYYSMKAFPVQFNPIEKELNKAGLREIVDLLIYTAMQDWNDISIIPREIDTVRGTIVYQSETFKIKEIGFVNHFSDTFLNVTFGLIKN
jgi:hypothetical protein